MSTVTERMEKNLDRIRELIGQINFEVASYNDAMMAGTATYGHVGDLARMRVCLAEALGIENETDPT